MVKIIHSCIDKTKKHDHNIEEPLGNNRLSLKVSRLEEGAEISTDGLENVVQYN